MAQTLPDILRCTYGASTLDLVDYSVAEEPVIKDGVGRIYTNVTVTADCELRVTTNAADYQAALAVVLADLRIDGRDFIVYGLGGLAEFGLLAATCMSNGPQVSFEETSGENALSKHFRLSIKGQRYDLTGGNSNSFKQKVATRPDGLQVVTRSGEVIGPGSANYYLTVALPAMQAIYHLPRWVVESEYESTQDANGSRVDYTITARQDFADLPVAPGPTTAVDGEMTQRVERDEHYRLVTTTDLDLLVIGDPQQMLIQIRTAAMVGQGGAAIQILRENFQITQVREQRLRGSFVTLQSADKSPLLNWTETVELQSDNQGYEIKEYPGAAPVLVRRPASVVRVTQTGSATSIGKYKTPTPRYASHLERPQLTMTDLNDVEKQITWRYVMYMSGAQNVPLIAAIDSFDATWMTRAAQDGGYFGITQGGP